MQKNLVIAFTLLFFNAIALAKPQPLSLEDIVNIRTPVSMEMSPDGNFIAYTLTKPRTLFEDDDGNNWREMYLISKRGKIVPFLTGGEAIGQLHWSADSQTIWFLARRAGSRRVSIYAISVNGGEAREIVRHESDIKGFDINDEESTLIYWAPLGSSKEEQQLRKWGFNAEVFNEDKKTNQLWRVELTGKGAKPESIYQHQHVLSAQFHPEKKHILLQTSPLAIKDSIVMNKALSIIDSKGAELVRFKHFGKMGKARFSPNGDYIAVIGSNVENLPAEGRLLVGRSDQEELVSVLPELNGQVRDIAWLSKRNLGFIVHKGTKSFLANKRISKPISELNKKYKTLSSDKSILRKMSVSEDGEQIGLVADTPRHPREIYWFSDDGLFQYTDSNRWLEQRELGEQRVVDYTARDGLELEGILVLPKGKQSKPLPLILFIHGGPEVHHSNGWLNRYSHPAHVAAAKGYASFFPNYRGSTGRGIAFTKAGQADYMGKEFEDILDARQHLIDKGIADPKRVGITGASYGGYAAAWAATKHSSKFAASVATMGIGNQLSKFGTTDIPTEMYQLHARSWPWENWQWMLERSPIYHAENAETPLLLLHGKTDPRVHYSQSMELYQYMKKLGKVPVRLVLYPNEGHGFIRSAAKLDYSMRLMRWMDRFVLTQQEGLPDMALPLQKVVESR